MKKLLHVGCGKKTKKDIIKYFHNNWSETRVDIDSKVNPDIIGSITNLSKIKNYSFDAIFTSHTIEHLFAHEVDIALKEFHRVLNKDGFLIITCPDLKSISKLVLEDKLLEVAYISPAGPITPLDMIYGYRKFIQQGNHYMSHKCGFTLKNLIGVLTYAKFKSVLGIERKEAFEIWVVAKKKKIEKKVFSKFVNNIFS